MTWSTSSLFVLLQGVVVTMAAAQSPVQCSRRPLSAERSFDTSRVRDLVGEYELVLVETTGPSSETREHRGELVLWLQDSLQSPRGILGPLPPGRGFERPIAGSFAAAAPDTGAWWRRMASSDRDRPGVMWMLGRLRLGDYDVLDGTGEDLVVTHLGPRGLRGHWQRDLGIAVIIDTKTHRQLPNPGGYFCAYRQAAR
jgi:hypothetical protein